VRECFSKHKPLSDDNVNFLRQSHRSALDELTKRYGDDFKNALGAIPATKKRVNADAQKEELRKENRALAFCRLLCRSIDDSIMFLPMYLSLSTDIEGIAAIFRVGIILDCIKQILSHGASASTHKASTEYPCILRRVETD
jgi:hypothetical protein